MYRHIVAASLFLIGTVYGGPATGSELGACRAGCAIHKISAPMVGETMNEDVARMVVRGATSSDPNTTLTKRDRLKLYILLALQGEGRLAVPGAQ